MATTMTNPAQELNRRKSLDSITRMSDAELSNARARAIASAAALSGDPEAVAYLEAIEAEQMARPSRTRTNHNIDGRNAE